MRKLFAVFALPVACAALGLGLTQAPQPAAEVTRVDTPVVVGPTFTETYDDLSQWKDLIEGFDPLYEMRFEELP